MDNKITGFVFDKVGLPKLEKYLDLAAFRHKLVSGNVANVSTPGYESRDMDFQAEFDKAVGSSSKLAGATTHPGHIPTGAHAERPPRVAEARVSNGDLNSVDIDQEVARMAQNELLFSIGSHLVKGKFEGLRKVITSK